MAGDSLGSGLGLATILAMACATYAVRAGGFFLLQRLKPSPFLEAWLQQIPAAVFVALVAPPVLSGGPAAWAGAAGVAVAWRLGAPFFVVVAAGVLLVAGARLL